MCLHWRGIACLSSSKKKDKKGKSLEEVANFVEDIKRKCCHWFMVEDLHHLKRGGRLNSLEAMVGTALRICPVLSMDKEGKLLVVQR